MQTPDTRQKVIADAICRIAEGEIPDDDASIRAAYPDMASEIIATYRQAVPEEVLDEWTPPADGGLFDGYRITGSVGEGGSAVIVRAEKDGRQVALKILPPIIAGESKNRLARFRREIKLLARLQHEDIVKCEALNIYNGTPYGVMEFIEGCSLDQLLFALKTGHDPIFCEGRIAGHTDVSHPPNVGAIIRDWDYLRSVVRLGAAIARILEFAHARGVIHRDIKPGNVMIRPNGQPALLDFGLAWDLTSPKLTQTGDLLGTPAYMAPEQASADFSKVGPQSDLYALAALLYECVTMLTPFRAESWWEVVKSVLAETPTPPRQVNEVVPRGLEAIIVRGMEKEIEKRFPTAAAMGRALEAVYLRMSSEGCGESTEVQVWDDGPPPEPFSPRTLAPEEDEGWDSAGSGESGRYEPQADPGPYQDAGDLSDDPPDEPPPPKKKGGSTAILSALLVLLLAFIAFRLLFWPEPTPSDLAARMLSADPAFPHSVAEDIVEPAERQAVEAYLALLTDTPPPLGGDEPVTAAISAVLRDGADASVVAARLTHGPLGMRVKVLLLLHGGKPAEAEEVWRQLLAKEGRRADLLVIGSRLPSQDAAELLAEAVRTAPNGFLGNWRLGELKVAQGDFAAGRERLEIAHSSTASAPASLQRALAVAWLRTGEVVDARKMLESLGDSTDSELEVLRGEAAYRAGQLAEARDHFLRAGMAQETRARAWLGLAAILYDEGMTVRARETFQRVGGPVEGPFWGVLYQKLAKDLGP